MGVPPAAPSYGKAAGEVARQAHPEARLLPHPSGARASRHVLRDAGTLPGVAHTLSGMRAPRLQRAHSGGSECFPARTNSLQTPGARARRWHEGTAFPSCLCTCQRPGSEPPRQTHHCCGSGVLGAPVPRGSHGGHRNPSAKRSP